VSGETKSVLIVEDDALISEALGEGLKRAGIKVSSASDGEEGLKKALADHPDLILLDLMMPKMNGHEMLKELRKDKWGAHVPVTVLTNVDDSLDIFMVTNYPNTNYAIKSSMKLEDIVNTVKERTKKTA
jgi:two-component system alkaline phosphatase synthesis response regulator PhoP